MNNAGVAIEFMDDEKIENIVCKFCFPFLLKIELLLGESQDILNYALKDGIDCFFSHQCNSLLRIQINSGEVLSQNEIKEILEYHSFLIEKSKSSNPKNCDKCHQDHPLRICQKLRAEYQQKKNLRACIICYRPNRKDSKKTKEQCWCCNRIYCSCCFQLEESIQYHPNEHMHNVDCIHRNEKYWGEKMKSDKCSVCGAKEN